MANALLLAPVGPVSGNATLLATLQRNAGCNKTSLKLVEWTG